MVPRARPTAARPRVEGEREEEILDAVVEHARRESATTGSPWTRVAKRARASKATLYRRWQTKQSLVVDAVIRSQVAARPAASRTPARCAVTCGRCSAASGWPPASETTGVLGVVVTALQTDPEFAADFRARFLAPKVARHRSEIYRRAAERGELAPGVDPSLLGPARSPGILLHRRFVLGEEITPDLVERVARPDHPPGRHRPRRHTAVQENA